MSFKRVDLDGVYPHSPLSVSAGYRVCSCFFKYGSVILLSLALTFPALECNRFVFLVYWPSIRPELRECGKGIWFLLDSNHRS